VASHLPGSDGHYKSTDTGTKGSKDSSGDHRLQVRIALIGAVGAIIAATVGAIIGIKPWSHPGSPAQALTLK
jgi:hypothetical protein